MSRTALIQACFGAILALVFARACVIFEPLPGWDGNPLVTVSAVVGLGPTGYLAFDAVAALLASLLCVLTGKRQGWVASVALLGGAAVVVRTMVFAAGNAEPLPIAGAWVSGAAVLAAGSVAASRPALRRFGIAVTMGFLCILLTKGAGQLLIEHPSVVETFEQDPEATLAARGYEFGSASALQFERRLRQPDITAWFGLSNVLAAYLAAGAVACLALCWRARRSLRLWPWITAAAFGLFCWAGVAATGSKAGLAIAAVGSTMFLAARFCTAVLGERAAGRKIIWLLGLGLWVLPVAAMAARALVLPFEGELSLLFRYFYVDAAVDIAKTNLPAGTGIDGFRAAYSIAKPPIAPETVTSSHNAITDWLAMLGIFGVPLALTAIGAAWQCAKRLGGQACVRHLASPSRNTVLSMVLVLSVPVVFSATLESAATLIELAVLRLVGLLLAGVVAVAAWRLRPGPTVAAALALIVLTHAQLDMLLFHPGSIPLAMLVVGLALPPGRSLGWKRWIGLIPAGCSVTLVVLCARAWQWEAPLRRAFLSAQAVAITTERAEMGSGAARSELQQVVREHVPVLRAELRSAADAMPRDPRAWLALCEIELQIAGPGATAWDAAVAAGEAEQSTRTLSRLATVARAIADRPASAPDRTIWIDRARQALVDASKFDPHGPHFPSLLAELEAAEGNFAPAAVWAARALHSDSNYALDPLAGLPDDRRRRLKDLVKDSPSGS